MQAVVEAILSVVIELILWPVGAAIKKLFRRPISASGFSEEWIGLSVIVAALFLTIWAVTGA